MHRLSIFLVIISLMVISCQQQTQTVPVGEYSGSILGNWQGTVGDYYREYLSFKKDNTFKVQLHSGGFIGNTISQGVYGTASGNWKIEDNKLTLDISRADDKKLFDQSRKYDIISFLQDELKLADERGDTSVFVRIHGM
jgi:hypothetical protein